METIQRHILKAKDSSRLRLASTNAGLVLQRKCACGNHTTSGGGECAECRKKREGGLLQRAATSPSAVSEVPPIVYDVLRSPGQPLDAETRAFMELRFAHDFSQVRVHTDSNAALSARSVRALAYTSGRHVVFDHDQYTPGSGHGQRLLAHELAHIVQAGASGDIAPNRVGDSNDSAEYEAEHMAEVVIAGRPSQPLSASTHVARTLRRYISPLDILDYIGIGLDVAERIYLVHFYEGSDRERQLFLNTLFLAMDLVLAALPGAGGGGLAMRASRGAMAIVWRATPMAAKRVIAERVAVAMGWTAIRAMQMINVMMREGGEGGGSGTSEGRGSSSESGGGSRETKSTGSSRSGASHLEQRAGWREQARNWFREHNITSTGSRDQITGKLVFSNRAVGRDRRYYTIDELHGQIEIFNHRYQHIGAMDINRGISLPAVSNRRIDI